MGIMNQPKRSTIRVNVSNKFSNKHLRLTENPSANPEKSLRRLDLGGHPKPAIDVQIDPVGFRRRVAFSPPTTTHNARPASWRSAPLRHGRPLSPRLSLTPRASVQPSAT